MLWGRGMAAFQEMQVTLQKVKGRNDRQPKHRLGGTVCV